MHRGFDFHMPVTQQQQTNRSHFLLPAHSVACCCTHPCVLGQASMSCDEDMCGDISGGSMVQSAHRPRSGFREQALCSAIPSELATSAASGSAPSELACILCLDNGQLPKEWRGRKLHSCWNAVKFYLRLCITQKMKDTEKCFFETNLEAWRKQVLCW